MSNFTETELDSVDQWPRKLKEDLLRDIADALNGKNLYGPFHTVEEAMASMLEDEQEDS